MSNPFEYVNSVSFDKNYLIVDDYSERQYNPYITNKQFSFFYDSILFSNEMNLNSHLDNKLQYDFYFFGLPKRKRFEKWEKFEDEEILGLVIRYYSVSREKAMKYMELLSAAQIEIIKETYSYGRVGRKPKNSR